MPSTYEIFLDVDNEILNGLRSLHPSPVFHHGPTEGVPVSIRVRLEL